MDSGAGGWDIKDSGMGWDGMSESWHGDGPWILPGIASSWGSVQLNSQQMHLADAELHLSRSYIIEWKEGREEGREERVVT